MSACLLCRHLTYLKQLVYSDVKTEKTVADALQAYINYAAWRHIS